MNYLLKNINFDKKSSHGYEVNKNKSRMGDAIYHIIVISVAAIGLIIGFRSGFTRQITHVLGLALGAVAARVFGGQLSDSLLSVSFLYEILPYPVYGSKVIGFSVVYVIVYEIFNLFTSVLKGAMRVFPVGMLDRICGAFFCMFNYLVFLSLLYNIGLCFNPENQLLKFAVADDGNVVESVLLLEPSMIGSPDVVDLAHLVQLREAKKISLNIRPVYNVILEEKLSQERG